MLASTFVTRTYGDGVYIIDWEESDGRTTFDPELRVPYIIFIFLSDLLVFKSG